MNRQSCAALSFAASLVALVALPARACDQRDRPYAPPPAAYPAPTVYVPAPVYRAVPIPAPAYEYRPIHWHAGWRARELRREYRRLDRARDRFYANWDGRPWTRDRFESWIDSRRVDLDRRWAELERWREHEREAYDD